MCPQKPSRKFIKNKYSEIMVDVTFGFDVDIESSTQWLDTGHKIHIATTDITCTNSVISEDEEEFCSNKEVLNEKHLLHKGIDPNLSESRLDLEILENCKNKTDTNKTHSVSDVTVGNQFISLSPKDRKLFNNVILRKDRDGDNYLFIAIISERTSLALLLISLISDHKCLNVCNKLYQTALHLAALTNNAKVARRLVVAGIELERRDKCGNTALHIACRKGAIEVAKALVNAVSFKDTKQNSYETPYRPMPQNLDIRNSDGLTCLHIAVIHKHKEVVKLLLNKDANINVVEMKAGKTCLHIAAESGFQDMVELILATSRPRLSQTTFAGYMATELAQYRGYDHIVYILRCKGAAEARPVDTIEHQLETKRPVNWWESGDEDDDLETDKEIDDEYDLEID